MLLDTLSRKNDTFVVVFGKLKDIAKLILNTKEIW